MARVVILVLFLSSFGVSANATEKTPPLHLIGGLAHTIAHAEDDFTKFKAMEHLGRVLIDVDEAEIELSSHLRNALTNMLSRIYVNTNQDFTIRFFAGALAQYINSELPMEYRKKLSAMIGHCADILIGE